MDKERQTILERFALVNNVPIEEAEKLFENADTLDKVLDQIKEFNIKKMEEQQVPLNRKQRRAAAKRLGKKGRDIQSVISNTALKLNYADLIQKLRLLNEKIEKENEENESTNEND